MSLRQLPEANTSSEAYRERVLVVDDQPVNRDVVEGHLAPAGYDVIKAEDGEEALLLFQAHQPDLVLLDILMPAMDGFATCRRLRQLPGGPATPVIFLTALADRETHDRALGSGADDFLTKPITRTELLIRVRSLLRIKRISRQLAAANETVQAQLDALVRERRRSEELTSVIVRDLKSYLSAIPANIRFAESDEGLSEDGRECLRDVLRSTSTVHRMLMNLVDVTRSDERRLELVLSDVSLADLIDASSREMAPRAQARQQVLETDCTVSGALRVDAGVLRRAIESLVDNSVRWGPSGSTVAIEARSADGHVELRVLDEGPAVAPEYRESIFHAHDRLAGDVDLDLVRGPGDVGLAFCRLAVEAHGGSIWVEPTSVGNAFCVRLPRTG